MLDAIYQKYGYGGDVVTLDKVKKEERKLVKQTPPPSEPKKSEPEKSEQEKLDDKKLRVCSNEKRELIEKIRKGCLLLAESADIDRLLNMTMAELEREREDVIERVGSMIKNGAEKAYTLSIMAAFAMESDLFYIYTGLDMTGLANKFKMQKDEIVDIFKEYVKDHPQLRKLLSKEARAFLLFVGLPAVTAFENMGTTRLPKKNLPQEQPSE